MSHVGDCASEGNEMPLKIVDSARVRYRTNPIIEVICQVKYPRVLELETRPPIAFQKQFSKDYPRLNVQTEPVLSVQFLKEGDGARPVPTAPRNVYHFISADGAWKATLSSQFVALSCLRYESWGDFERRVLPLIKFVEDEYGVAWIERVGLRYQDLIDRAALGVSDAPWTELLVPFVLGPFAAFAMFEGERIDEADVKAFGSHAQFEIEGCSVLLQTSLVNVAEPPGKPAILIDADYYVDHSNELLGCAEIKAQLQALHSNAGKLFRACITPKLRDALGPVAVADK